MTDLAKHNQTMRKLFESSDFDSLRSMVDLDTIDAILRQCLSIEEMREAGSFFTGQSLATKAVASLQKPIDFDSIILDPNCGAGNLLIECSRKLETKSTLSLTLQCWGKVLWGFDIYTHFIEAAKIRIVIEAVNRGVLVDCSLEDAFNLLANIRVQDALLADKNDLGHVTHAIMNPPFSVWPSPIENYWKRGKVNAAGVFFDKYLRLLPHFCCISAILPDVLRSGSRYSDFRDFANLNFHGKCMVWGRFSPKAHVDVFILSGSLLMDDKYFINWHKDLGSYTPISDFYDVTTGPLVAYRDPEEGKLYPYFHPKNCPVWGTVDEVTEKRRFNGRVVEPPVILVKRTSSPSGKNRASATIINITGLIAVENHMLIIKPKSKKLKDCYNLLKILNSQETNDYLNDRARMRHLTVQIIKDIPFKWS